MLVLLWNHFFCLINGALTVLIIQKRSRIGTGSELVLRPPWWKRGCRVHTKDSKGNISIYILLSKNKWFLLVSLNDYLTGNIFF